MSADAKGMDDIYFQCGVTTRACRAGDAHDTEVRMEKRWDQEEQEGTPMRVVQWVQAVLGPEQAPPCSGGDWKAIQMYFRDGVVLCRLSNKLLAAAGQPKQKFRARVNSSFHARGNIDIFVNGCKAFGLEPSFIFEPSDIVEGRKGPLCNVIHCLHQLGRLANLRGFQPIYQIPKPPKADWALDDE